MPRKLQQQISSASCNTDQRCMCAVLGSRAIVPTRSAIGPKERLAPTADSTFDTLIISCCV